MTEINIYMFLKYSHLGLLCLLALSGPETTDGRDRLDDTEDSLPKNHWRGGQGVRQAEAGRQGRLIPAAVGPALVQF